MYVYCLKESKLL